MVGSQCITLDPWVLVRVVVEAKTSESSKCGILASDVSRSTYFDNHLWESIQT